MFCWHCIALPEGIHGFQYEDMFRGEWQLFKILFVNRWFQSSHFIRLHLKIGRHPPKKKQEHDENGSVIVETENHSFFLWRPLISKSHEKSQNSIFRRGESAWKRRRWEVVVHPMTFTPKVVPSGLFSRCFRPGFGGRDSTNQRGQTEGSDGFRASIHPKWTLGNQHIGTRHFWPYQSFGSYQPDEDLYLLLDLYLSTR